MGSTTAESAAQSAGSTNLKFPAQLYEQLSDSVAVYTPEGRCLYLNKLSEELLGKPREELVGRVLWEVFPEAVGNMFHQTFERVTRTGESESFDHYYAPWKRWFANNIYLVDRQVWVLAREITERTTQKERYQALFDSIDFGYCLMQLHFDADDRPLDYTFLETNGSFEAHTGLKDAVGKTARQLVPGLDSSWFERYGKVALTGVVDRFENHAPAMGRWFEVSASRVGDPKLRQVALVFKDITARKDGEAELTAALAREKIARTDAVAERHKLHSLFMQTPIAICILEGPQLIFSFANPAYRALVDNRDVEGKPLLDAIPDLKGQGFDVLLRQVMSTGEAFNGNELPVKLAHNEKSRSSFMNFVYSPKRNAAGEVDGVVVSASDVTEQVHARKHAEQLTEQLRERVDFEQQLVGIVSHDLRNPLSAMLLAASSVLKREGIDERATRSLRRILSSGERANRLIHDLLDFTQARLGGGIPIQRSPQDLRDLIAQVVEDAQLEHPEREIQVQFSGNGSGEWDGDRLTQVATNLLTNAVSYSPADSLITIKAACGPKEVVIEVTNAGPPIPADVLPVLFLPMRRGDAMADKSARSIGLGLFIVDHVVRAHGGKVEVRSTVGEGTTFTVKLPRTQPPR